MKKGNPWPIDEPVEQISQGWVIALLSLGAAFFGLCGLAAQETILRVLGLFWAAVMIAMIPLVRWINRHYRIVINEQGVRLGEKHALRWEEIHTAAIILRGNPRWKHYNRRRGDWHLILLSVQLPEQAIDKWNFRLEAAKPGRDVRVPYTGERRQAVEHYLGRTLPEIKM